MGLAASQARLLSITSRMADNELRSQLINNAKMRLTADTSKVSDEYVAALNRTKLMFSNFDLEGNELFQELTFSSLTAYSAYNTQYGIVDNNGQIVVSVTDADNFEKADGDLEEFLKLYGLEKTTDYWETMQNSEEFNSMVVDAEGNTKDFIKGIGYYDEYDVWQPLDVTVDEMKAIYEAEAYNGIEHYGQRYSLSSPEYADYLVLENEFISAREQFEAAVKTSTREWLAGDLALMGEYFKVDGKEFEHFYGEAMRKSAGEDTGHPTSYYVEKLQEFGALVGLNPDFSVNTGAADPFRMMKDHWKEPGDPSFNQPWIDMLQLYAGITSAVAGTPITTYEYNPNGYAAYYELNADGSYGALIQGTPISISTTGTGTPVTVNGYPSGTGTTSVYISDPPQSSGTQAVQYNGTLDPSKNYVPAWVMPDGTLVPPYTSGADVLQNTPELNISTSTLSQQAIDEALKDLYNTFRDNLINQMSDQEFIKLDHQDKGLGAADKWEAYIEAATNLAKFIYGENSGAAIVQEMMVTDKFYHNLNMVRYLNDPGWVLSMNKNLDEMNGEAEHKGYYYDVDWDIREDGFTEDKDVDSKLSKSHTNPFVDTYPTTTCVEDGDPDTISASYTRWVKDPATGQYVKETSTKEYQSNYQVVKDLFLIDCMLEHYGEPTYTWIDQNNKGEDGTAKARWYTNLFNRMKQGYKNLAELDQGVKNSADWLQFALESGLVHMEQVDSKDVWNPTLYSNCAKITESSVDIDVTLAEAKYKREMAKIQAKDKQYDIELKNIDTEHESLKQEAETIKEVINNNIKNNMKLFVQG